MIEYSLSGSLFVRSEDSNRAVMDLTITLPTQTGLTVVASIQLSTAAPGAHIQIHDGRVGGFVGWASCGVTKIYRMSPGGLVITDASVPAPKNVRKIGDCLAVTFRLAAVLSEARALAMVFVSKPPRAPWGDVLEVNDRMFAIDTRGGESRIHYVHDYLTVAGNKPVSRPSVAETARVAAEAIGVETTALKVQRATRTGVALSKLFAGAGTRKGMTAKPVNGLRASPASPSMIAHLPPRKGV